MRKNTMLLLSCICFILLIGAGGSSVYAENNARSEKKTEAGTEKAGKEIVLHNLNIKECVYEQLGKEDGEPLYEEELADCEGKLHMYDAVIMSGEDLDFVRRYFDMPSEWDVTFPAGKYEAAGTEPVMDGWSREQLEGLGYIEGDVCIRASEETIPVSVLSYFTKAESLSFIMRDVTGEPPENWHFPENVKNVSLSYFSSAGYRNLMHYMEGSQIEQLSVYTDAGSTFPRIFWLDHVAGMKELRSLYLDDNAVRVRDKSSLKGMGLSYLQCRVDGSEDIAILNELSSLEKVSLAVTKEMDLTSLLSREKLELRLRFCRVEVEFDEDIYGEEEPVVIPSFDKSLRWRNDIRESVKPDKPGYFLAIYQRCMDAGRMIECFTVRFKEETGGDSYEIKNVVTFFRVTDGEKRQVIMTECATSPDSPFGEYRRDNFQMQDINFDGIKDIVLDSGSQGTGAVSYDLAWIWDRESGEYTECESYRGIQNPSVDKKQKLIRSSWRNGAASHGFGIYRYEDGEFVMKSKMEESLLFDDEIPEELEVPEGGEVWEWVETIYGDDGKTETRSFFGKRGERPKELSEKYFSRQ